MKKCEFCHESNYLRSSNGDHCLSIEKHGDVELSFQREYDCEPWNVGAFKFNYCPMCGRRLIDEN